MLSTTLMLLAGCGVILLSGAIALRNAPVVQYEAAMTQPAVAQPATAVAADVEPPVEDQSAAVKKLYVLPADKVIVRVSAAQEVRDELYQELSPAQARRMRRTPGAMLVRWENGELKNYGMTWGSGYSAQMLLQMLLQAPSQQVETTGDIPMLGGDIIFKMGAKPEEYMQGLEQIFRDELKVPCTISFREVQRPVIVLKGKWKYTSADPVGAKGETQPTLQMYGIKLDKNRENGGTAEGSTQNLARWIGGWISKEVVVEAEGMPDQIRIHYNYDETQQPDTREKARLPANVLGHIQEQTGLKWSEETRTVRRIVIERTQ